LDLYRHDSSHEPLHAARTSLKTSVVRRPLRNTGTISSETNSSVILAGNWDNTNGTIGVDSSSTLLLGFPTFYDRFAPPFTDGLPYALNLSQVGTVDIANGATVGLGGFMTTDKFNALLSLPGVTFNPAQDTLVLTGWLDNSPADNPVSQGVLAINASTGVLYLGGGDIYHGKITTSGSDYLVGSFGLQTGFLDGVELDGYMSVIAPDGYGAVVVLNGLTLNGTIDMPGSGSYGVIGFGFFDNAPETISGTGTIFLGSSGALVDQSNAGLTIGSGITIDAGATYSYLEALGSFVVNQYGSTIENLGTIEDLTAGSALHTVGIDP
jgi:hypothetical protein